MHRAAGRRASCGCTKGEVAEAVAQRDGQRDGRAGRANRRRGRAGRAAGQRLGPVDERGGRAARVGGRRAHGYRDGAARQPLLGLGVLDRQPVLAWRMRMRLLTAY